MKLLVKFNLLLIAVFGVGLFLISFAARTFLQKQAQSEVLREASLMSASALATSGYTEKKISPLLEKTPEHAALFLPQTTPSSPQPAPSSSCAPTIRTTPCARRR